ncbi:MAG: hypothetical protein KAT43_06300 [Nanoarchaeota archaeon]|nr:hypothetical protein [Nanoarchaeota archaeon]
MAKGDLFGLEDIAESDILDKESGITYRSSEIMTSGNWTAPRLWKRIRANTDPEFQKNVDIAFTIIYGGNILRLDKLQKLEFLKKADLKAIAEDLKDRGVIEEHAEASFEPDPETPSFEEAVRKHRRRDRAEALRRVRDERDRRLGLVREKEGIKTAHIYKLKCIVAKYGFNVIELLNSLEPSTIFDKNLDNTLKALSTRHIHAGRIKSKKKKETPPTTASASQCEICSHDTSRYSITWREVLPDGRIGSRSLKTGKYCGSSLFSLFDIDGFRQKLASASLKEQEYDNALDIAFAKREKEEKDPETKKQNRLDRAIQEELEEEYRKKLLARLEEADRIRKEYGDASEMLRAMQVRASYIGFFREAAVAGDLPARETEILLKMIRRPASVTEFERDLMLDFYNRECYFKKSETVAPILEDIEWMIKDERLRVDNPRYLRARTNGLLGADRDAVNSYEIAQILDIAPNILPIRQYQHQQITKRYRRHDMDDMIANLFDILEKDRGIQISSFKTLRGTTRNIGSDFWTVNKLFERWVIGKAAVYQSRSDRTLNIMKNISNIESIKSFEEKYKLLMPIYIKTQLPEYQESKYMDLSDQFVLREDVEENPEKYFGIRGVDSKEILNTVMYSLSTTNSVYRKFVNERVKKTETQAGIEKLLRKGIISTKYLGKDGQIAKWYRSLRKRKVKKADKDLLQKIKDIHKASKQPHIVAVHPFEAYSQDLGKVRYVSSDDAKRIAGAHRILTRLSFRFGKTKSRTVANALKALNEKYKGHYVIEEDGYFADLRIRDYRGPTTKVTPQKTQKNPYVVYYDPATIAREKKKLDQCVEVEGRWLDKLAAVLTPKVRKHFDLEWSKPHNLSSIREEGMPEKIFVNRKVKNQVEKIYRQLEDMQIIDIDDDFAKRYAAIERLANKYPILRNVWKPSFLEELAYNVHKGTRAGKKFTQGTITNVEKFDTDESLTNKILYIIDPVIAAVVRKEKGVWAKTIFNRVLQAIKGDKNIWKVIHGTVEGIRYRNRKRTYEARLAGKGRYDKLHLQDFTQGLRDIAEPKGEIEETEFRVPEYVLRNLFIDRLMWNDRRVNITPISVVDRLGIDNIDKPLSEVPERKTFLEEIAKGLLEGEQYSVYLEDHEVGRFYKVQASQGEAGVIRVTGMYGNLREERKLSLKYKGGDYLEAARQFVDTALQRFKPRRGSARHYVENFREDFDLKKIPELADIKRFEDIVNQELQRHYTLRELIA